MKITIAFSGPAGSGIFTAGKVLGDILAKKGYYVVGDKQYASVIKGDNNIFVLNISDKHHFQSKSINHFIYFDKFALNKNQTAYLIENKYLIKKDQCIYQNTFAIGLASKLLGLPIELAQNFYTNKFKGEILEKNLTDLNKGFDQQEKSILKLNHSIEKTKEFIFGNEIIGKGAVDSGLEYYSAYPMTPASTLIEVINSYGKDKTFFFQGEDEIAVAMAMLGAKFAGNRSMCGTSGGGFALMSESISFSNMAEIGGVYVLSQRAGPSTGSPTYTEQGDLNYALNSSFGDTYPIVISPSSFEDAYNLIGKALNWSDIYQHPVIFLIDRNLSESYISINPNNLNPEPINKGKQVSEANENFKRYEINDNGISAYSIPGIKNGEFNASSYEHDEYGASIDEPENKLKMTKKRHTKLQTFINDEFNDSYYGYEIINPDATKFFITFGYNRYTLEGFIQENNSYGLIIIKNLQPLDFRLKNFLNKSKTEKLIFVEQNYSGQLEKLITKEFDLENTIGKDKISNIRKYTLYPFYEEDLV